MTRSRHIRQTKEPAHPRPKRAVMFQVAVKSYGNKKAPDARASLRSEVLCGKVAETSTVRSPETGLCRFLKRCVAERSNRFCRKDFAKEIFLWSISSIWKTTRPKPLPAQSQALVLNPVAFLL